MERHIQALLHKISFACIAFATFTLVLLFLQTPETCVPTTTTTTPAAATHKSLHRPHAFPKSSCDTSHRQLTSLDKKNQRLWATKSWKQTVHSYTHFFLSLQSLSLLHNHSKVLCLSAGPGQAVMALSQLGVADVTGIEVVDSPPLVLRADPHNLPFFDHVFDLAFSAHFAEALFPARFVSEMERTVRRGGFCVLAVEDCGTDDVKEIAGLFRRARFVSAENVTLTGVRMTGIIMRIRIPP